MPISPYQLCSMQSDYLTGWGVEVGLRGEEWNGMCQSFWNPWGKTDTGPLRLWYWPSLTAPEGDNHPGLSPVKTFLQPMADPEGWEQNRRGMYVFIKGWKHPPVDRQLCIQGLSTQAFNPTVGIYAKTVRQVQGVLKLWLAPSGMCHFPVGGGLLGSVPPPECRT